MCSNKEDDAEAKPHFLSPISHDKPTLCLFFVSLSNDDRPPNILIDKGFYELRGGTYPDKKKLGGVVPDVS